MTRRGHSYVKHVVTESKPLKHSWLTGSRGSKCRLQKHEEEQQLKRQKRDGCEQETEFDKIMAEPDDR